MEADQRLRDARRAGGELAQFAARHIDADQPRIGKNPDKFVGEVAAVAAGEALEVEVIAFGEFEQKGRRERPLVALDQVQIAYRNAQVAGHAGLRQAARGADAADAGAGKQLAAAFFGQRWFGEQGGGSCQDIY